jgi:V8-like Glu-specific endopeptidase
MIFLSFQSVLSMKKSLSNVAFLLVSILILSSPAEAIDLHSLIKKANEAAVLDRQEAPDFEAPEASITIRRQLTKALERVISATSEATPEEKIAVYQNISPGFDTLVETSSLPAVGPQVTGIENGVVPLNEQGLESVIFGEDFLPASFLLAGADAQKPVGRVAWRATQPTGMGTGFLVSNNLFLTNNHVIPSAEAAKRFFVQMNYQLPYRSEHFDAVLPLDFDVDAAGGFYTNPDPLLDYTIVRVKWGSQSVASTVTPGQHFGFLRLENNILYSINQPVNIIQHPGGRHKEIAIHANTLSGVFDKVIRYTTDTEGGSSGSPVFNNSWSLIGLHHAGGTNFNEGIRIDKIVEDIARNAPDEIRVELGFSKP